MYGASAFLMDWLRAAARSLYAAGKILLQTLEPLQGPVRRMAGAMTAALERFPGPLDRIRLPFPVFIAAALTLLVLLLWPNIGFNFLRDEGYLWYGAQRVLAGELPFRDFQSYYDPARYYLTAAAMAVLGGPGILALWRATALFGALTAALACWLVFRRSPRTSLWVTLAFTATLIVWMFPESYKLLDIGTSLVQVAVLAWLIHKPTQWRCFMAGVVLGLVAIMGRNHALYGIVADVVALGCMALVERRVRFWSALAYGALGGFVSYLPMLLALAVVPGLWAPFWDGIRIYFVLGRTNLGIPVPWPWLLPHDLPAVEKWRYLIVGCLLIAQPLIGLAVVGRSLWRAAVHKLPLDPLVFAAALLAILYTHHAFARAGLSHLAQAIYPLLVLLFALVTARPPGVKLVLVTLICALSVFVEWRAQPISGWGPNNRDQATQIGTDMVWLDKYDVNRLTQLTALVDKYAPGGREFVAVPYMPGYYAMFDRRAGVWASYMLSPAGSAEQQREIARIAADRPAFVLIEEEQQDHNRALSFWSTHHDLNAYIQQHFHRVMDPDVPPRMQLYLPSEPAP